MTIRCISVLLPFLLAIGFTVAEASSFDVLDYVDPLIGTVNGGELWNKADLLLSFSPLTTDLGHVFPGI